MEISKHAACVMIPESNLSWQDNLLGVPVSPPGYLTLTVLACVPRPDVGYLFCPWFPSTAVVGYLFRLVSHGHALGAWS